MAWMASPSTRATAGSDGDLLFIVSEQRRELSTFQQLDSDFDIAFDLQMQEALAASVAFEPSSSSSSASASTAAVATSSSVTVSSSVAFEPSSSSSASASAAAVATSSCVTVSSSAASDSAFAKLQSQELARFEQERRDFALVEEEMKKIKTDLDRLCHDRKFAAEIDRVPSEDWEEEGDYYERPYHDGEGSSSSSGLNSQIFRVYFKGLFSEERVWGGDSKKKLAGIGVAVCDPWDNPIVELSKPLPLTVGMSRLCMEAKALIEGLNAALALDLKRITFFCDYFPMYQFCLGRWKPKQHKVHSIIHQAQVLFHKFTYCRPSLVPRNDVKFAFKLAREAVDSQIPKSTESSNCRNLVETCIICLEDTDSGEMFTVDGCLHRYCYSCMKQHVEVKLLHGMVPRCPHDGCKSELNVESCRKFLTPKLTETMKQHIKEASIPVPDKLYCPYPRCSALMSRTEVSEYSKNLFAACALSGAARCTKCHGLFCMKCKVPWHSNMTCFDYKILHPFPQVEDEKLKSLASRNLWRQCAKCNHMIELAEGCYHMTCRCGSEFCYTCGAEWKNKTATCSCALWDVRNIINDEDLEDEFDDFDDDEEDEDYDSDEDYLF